MNIDQAIKIEHEDYNNPNRFFEPLSSPAWEDDASIVLESLKNSRYEISIFCDRSDVGDIIQGLEEEKAQIISWNHLQLSVQEDWDALIQMEFEFYLVKWENPSHGE